MRLGPYEVVASIGQGGMGTVLRGRAPDGRAVALKLLRRPTADAIARFDRERRLLASLTEAEGFVPLLDAGDAPEGPWLAMPFVPGGTLRDRLRRGALSIDDAVALGQALAGALRHAHERGIVHRDLKPENVLFAADGRPLVADLGLARHFRHDAPGASQSVSLSREATGRGTMGYSAPEQMHDAHAAGPAADVFALGAILHECLAGVPAFDGDTLLEVASAIEACRPAPLARLRPDAPRWLVREIERALSRDPARRHPDGGALARSLVPPVRRGRGVAVVLGGAAVLAIAGIALTLLRPAEARRSDEAPLAPVASAASPRAIAGDPTGAARRRAQGLFLGGDQAGALAELEAAIAASTDEVDRLELRAAQRKLEGNHAAGVALLEEAIRRAPMRASARGLLAASLEDAGRHADAAARAREALALDPENGLASEVLGIALMTIGDHAGARDVLDRLIARAPEGGLLYYRRSYCRSKLGDAPGALADARRATELLSQSLVAWARLGDLLQAENDHEGAIEAYRRCTRLDPKNANGWTNLGTTLVRAGRIDEGMAAYDAAVAVEPPYAFAFFNRALARLEKKRDPAGALPDLARAIELEPRSALFLFNSAVVRLALGDEDGALADLDRAVAVDPDYVPARHNRGSLRVRRGDGAGARDDFRRAVEREPKGASHWHGLGCALALLGDHREALRHFDRAVDLGTGDPEISFDRAASREATGDLDGAIADLAVGLAIRNDAKHASDLERLRKKRAAERR